MEGYIISFSWTDVESRGNSDYFFTVVTETSMKVKESLCIGKEDICDRVNVGKVVPYAFTP